MKVDVPNLKPHELAASCESLISDAEHGPFAIRAQTFAGALDKFLDVLPPQRVRLALPR
jgi:hypothetical protein